MRQTIDLSGFSRRVGTMDGNLLFFIDPEFINADDDPFPGFNRPLISVGRLVNLVLNPTVLDRAQHAAEIPDLAQLLVGLFFDPIRQGFDCVSTADRIHGVCDARFKRKNLLRPQSETGRIRCRYGESFVFCIRME